MLMKIIKYTFFTICGLIIVASFLPEPPKTTAAPSQNETVIEKPKPKITEIVLVKKPAKPKERVFDRSGSAAICQMILKKRVKYPATLKVHSDRRYARNAKIYQVGFSFTSRNGFNVPVTQKVYCNFNRKTHLFASIFIQER